MELRLHWVTHIVWLITVILYNSNTLDTILSRNKKCNTQIMLDLIAARPFFLNAYEQDGRPVTAALCLLCHVVKTRCTSLKRLKHPVVQPWAELEHKFMLLSWSILNCRAAFAGLHASFTSCYTHCTRQRKIELLQLEKTYGMFKTSLIKRVFDHVALNWRYRVFYDTITSN